MKNIICSLIIVLVVALNGFTQICFFDFLENRVKESDIIVIGTLTKPVSKSSTKSKKNSFYTELEIVVERVVAGNVKTNEGLSLKRNDKIPIKDFNGSFSKNEPEKGIFLLTLDNNGSFESQHFYELSNLNEVKKYLKKYPKNKEKIKILNITNFANTSPQTFLTERSFENNFCELSIDKSNKNEYSPFQALLVILISFPTYYLLYRSRFKIR